MKPPYGTFQKMSSTGRMLKALSDNPWVYIYRYYNIDPKEGFLTCFKICSKIRQWYMPEKRRSTKMLYADNPRAYWYFLSFKTILRPISVKLIFWIYCLPPMLQISDFGISDQKCHHRSANCIIIPRKCKFED